MQSILDQLRGNPLHPVFVGPGAPLAGVMISLSYVILTVAVIWIVVDGFRYRSYGMPIFGIVGLLGLVYICAFPGPALYPHLFRRMVEAPALLWMWRGWFVLHLTLFWQFLWFSAEHPRFWPQIGKWMTPAVVLLLLIVTYGEWAFITFYQDVYINEAYALVILVMSINYVSTLFWRVRLKGLSIPVAWLWLIGNSLLYGSIVIGGMVEQYPCHDGLCGFACDTSLQDSATCWVPTSCPDQNCRLQFDTGFAFIYFVYGVTIAANLAYAIGLTWVRGDELRPEWDATRTLERMAPAPVTRRRARTT